MGVKVNESGTIKNLALDRDEVEVVRVNIQIPAVKANTSGSVFKPSNFGITKGYYTNKIYTYSEGSYAGKKYVQGLGTENDKNVYIYWPDIPDDCKFTVKRGKLNFRLTVPCKVKPIGSTSEYAIDELVRFPEYVSASPKGFNKALSLYEIGNSTYMYRSYIALVLTIENEEDWRIDACLVYSVLTETQALNAGYGYNGWGSTTLTRPKSWYLINQEYLITKMAYSDYGNYATDSVITI